MTGLIGRYTLAKYLAGGIKRAYKEYGFLGVIIYGLQGTGKTTLGLWIMRYVYGNWDAALDYMFYSIDELIALLEEVRGKRIPAIMADDAGAHLSKYLAHIDIKAANALTAFLQVIRTTTSGFIITVPHPAFLAKSIRDQPDWLYVSLRKTGRRGWVAARIYSMYPLPTRLIPRRLTEEEIPFYARLPPDIHRRYNRIRELYSVSAADELIERLKEVRQGKGRRGRGRQGTNK